MSNTPIYKRPAELLQKLIQFDTTNPPGNELACVTYIKSILDAADIPSMTLAKDPNRPNLIARLKGRGEAPPLLLQGHVDVVTTTGQKWSHPPFAAELADDFVWGRGALDMKGGVAMMLAAFLRASAEGAALPGDVILTVLADEEAGGEYGAKFLVEEHAEQFKGVHYALGEFGGFTLFIGGQRFYPIMVAEKQICWLKMTIHGPAGHGSMPVRGGAMARLGEVLQTLDRKRLPVHITPVARHMMEGIAKHLSFPTNVVLRQLLNPTMTNGVLTALGEQVQLFDPLLHNTVSPTGLRASDKTNVIPGQVELLLDGRLLPGFTPADMLAELHALLGDDVDIEVMAHDPGPPQPDMGLFNTLAGILQEADPEGIAVPLLLSGVTDARFFAQLGIQTYGFLPMQLPSDFNFAQTIHAADERIPAAALDFGTAAIYQALQRFDK
ncbi:MAG: M20/M25/M40 family metallo-hydrolase [Anaerolineales bacterium]|nr:M20/M25/M40 family metallo-hydrolase [Anaerolineales bacterium]MCB8990809.1 M20/M25/M40 family metallo-hydrolase [Ardenticatenaceae bacterium]MCB9004497.1 M20/M25/M40 family metallo-hydrolase [Ardenticatenaceae bacterium]